MFFGDCFQFITLIYGIIPGFVTYFQLLYFLPVSYRYYIAHQHCVLMAVVMMNTEASPSLYYHPPVMVVD